MTAGRWSLTCCCLLTFFGHEGVLVGCSSASSLSRHGRYAADEFSVAQRQLELRGGGKNATRRGKSPRSAATQGHSNASSPPRSPAGNAETANGLFEEMKRLLRTGEIPKVEALAPSAHRRAPKRGPGSRHRTPPLAGWAKNLGGNFGVELPEGGLAGGGLLPEPNRVKWATRLANSSDTCAHLGHKLVQLCDNVSVGIDPATERGPFYLDVPAALDCIDKGADVNGRGPFDLSPLLMLCAADGHEMMIERLLDAGADVHAQDSSGNTPLHEAVRCRSKGDMRSIQVVKMLLEAGANVHQADIWNVTALEEAHSSLARHSWWSGLGSVEAAQAREIVGILGGNVDFGEEQVVLQEAKWQRRIDREQAKRDAKLERRAALLEEQRRAGGLDHEYLPVD